MRRPVPATQAIILAGLVTVFGGCAPSLNPRILGMRQAWSPVKIALFLPVEGRHRETGGEFLDDGPQVVREAVERELRKLGCSLASDSVLDAVVYASTGTPDVTFGQAAELAGKVGADIAVVGRLVDYRRGWLFGPSTRVQVRFDIVAIDGQGLGAVRYAETAAQEDPAELARDISFKIAREIDHAWGGCPVLDSTMSP